jgi:CubicO group peptidase (beta-lactamase class C family)
MNEDKVLQRVAPEEVGVSSRGIIDFLDSVYDKQINLHSFMLLRHGKVAVEGFYKPFDSKLLHNIFSVSKSVTSAAVGIAIQEGLLSIEDKIVDFFSEKLEGNVHEYTEMMKIKHLLAMATVHPRSTDTNIKDWVKGFLNTPPSHIPGTIFAYDTTGTHTLCAILQKVTGMTVHEYLKRRLFDPIGIGEIYWETCPMGINKGGSGIKCTTEDLARFGQLYLQKGSWCDNQVISESWIELSTAKHIDNSNTRMLLDGHKGYGYQFWRTRNNSYCAFGMGGQLVVVIPEKDVVFACTANTLIYKDGQQMILDSFWENIYPVISNTALAEDKTTYSELIERLNKLTLVLPEGEGHSYTADMLKGRTINLDENSLGYNACEFTFAGDFSKLTLCKGETKVSLNFGMNKWIEDSEPFFGLKCTSAATWVDEKTIILNIQLFEELQMFILTCRFDEDYMVIQVQPVGVLKTEQLEVYLNGRLM